MSRETLDGEGASDWLESRERAAGRRADDATGFNVAPVRYSAQGRETIDQLRDAAPALFAEDVRGGLRALLVRLSALSRAETRDLSAEEVVDLFMEEERVLEVLGDAAFSTYSALTSRKYLSRQGLKGPAEEDLSKAQWYAEMREAVARGGPDPRRYRPGFSAYIRKESP